jgi:hypothetical protein
LIFFWRPRIQFQAGEDQARARKINSVLIVTACNRVDNCIAGLDAGEDDCMTKPSVLGALTIDALARPRCLHGARRKWRFGIPLPSRAGYPAGWSAPPWVRLRKH